MSKRFLMGLLAIGAAGALATSIARADETIITSKQLKWKPSPYLPGSQTATLYGDRTQSGPYAYRVKFPANFKTAPHSHPDDRVYTIISGTYYVGEGEKFDKAALKPVPAGGFVIYKSGTKHFSSTKEPVVLQVNGVGPTDFTYANPADDPRKK